ncbi:MAG: hypothetical protein A2015_11210 [Spirochaetes bacterium GWF1_31_7]|nr:MAG: hypothetical protein A2Y30_02445 [Spirochaetes bacterium GWE1_32_154]OHD46846.1 MAG: hypothetical protein A2Y29_09940 [Spirochaetes bacterium GWE2_31_10]OHD47767.1 MAG: hypothetical protein A2015_11210 [Spirochaetes bacterium GWF1_31_7]OHD81227.1 MAG: hypothetical protein A2355_02160 [Spirochaetes bacterium RIFOXYB1_FULL_32_8]HBD95620.1 hypothetical protein [Spirochaetia bacterium]
MYTATMRYVFKSDFFMEGCRIWNDTVMIKAIGTPGLVRMQLLTGKSEALAVGTWEDKSFAEQFMQSGVFKVLLEKLSGMLISDPIPEQWNLTYFYGSK